MIVFETELSSAVGEYIVYLHSDEENPVGYVQPEWWTSSDLTHSEIFSADSEKILSISHGGVWKDLEMAWTDEPETDTTDATGNIVVFADFKRTNETE
jgi:hypothetical protein